MEFDYGNDKVKYKYIDGTRSGIKNYHNTENYRISHEIMTSEMIRLIMISLRLMNIAVTTRQLSISANHELRLTRAETANQRSPSPFSALIFCSSDEVFVRWANRFDWKLFASIVVPFGSLLLLTKKKDVSLEDEVRLRLGVSGALGRVVEVRMGVYVCIYIYILFVCFKEHMLLLLVFIFIIILSTPHHQQQQRQCHRH